MDNDCLPGQLPTNLTCYSTQSTFCSARWGSEHSSDLCWMQKSIATPYRQHVVLPHFPHSRHHPSLQQFTLACKLQLLVIGIKKQKKVHGQYYRKANWLTISNKNHPLVSSFLQPLLDSWGERESIFHIATTLEWAHNRNAKLGGLPERHLAHQSWPPIKRQWGNGYWSLYNFYIEALLSKSCNKK